MGTDAILNIGDGFSAIYEEYERLSLEDPIDISRRNVVRRHIEKFLKPHHKILELNAGSGIDAMYFAEKGYDILATDISDGAEFYIKKKIKDSGLVNLRFRKCSFTELQGLDEAFDHIFSNFGGLNCTDDLIKVFAEADARLNAGGYITLVVMPPCYPWEMARLLTGNKNAFRRLQKNGIVAHVGNRSFTMYYHTPAKIRKSSPRHFRHINTRDIGTFYPSAHFTSLRKYKKIISALVKFDTLVNDLGLPFKGIGDYYLITFQKGNPL